MASRNDQIEFYLDAVGNCGLEVESADAEWVEERSAGSGLKGECLDVLHEELAFALDEVGHEGMTVIASVSGRTKRSAMRG